MSEKKMDPQEAYEQLMSIGRASIAKCVMGQSCSQCGKISEALSVLSGLHAHFSSSPGHWNVQRNADWTYSLVLYEEKAYTEAEALAEAAKRNEANRG